MVIQQLNNKQASQNIIKPFSKGCISSLWTIVHLVKKQNVYTKNTVERKEKIKMDRIDTEKIMMNEHGGLPRCNKTTCKTACMEFVEY